MKIRFLGVHNTDSASSKAVSFLVDGRLVVDAGGLCSGLTFTEQQQVEAILISHGHYDHIKDVPTFAFNNQERETPLYSRPQTLEILAERFFDNLVYPDFMSANNYLGRKVLEPVTVALEERHKILDYRVKAYPVNHDLDSVGFEITGEAGRTVFYTGDTGPGLAYLWQKTAPHLLIVEVTFPNRLKQAAKDSFHLCPESLGVEMADFHSIEGYWPRVITIHAAPQMEEEIAGELNDLSRRLQTPIAMARENGEIEA